MAPAEGGPEVLANGDDVHARLPQVTHYRQKFRPRLAQAYHKARLGDDLGIHLLRPGQQLQRTLVPGTWPDELVESGHCLHIVPHHMRAGIDYSSQGLPQASKIGHQNLYLTSWDEGTTSFNTASKESSATIGQIVSGY